jgi:hypothetical protein
VAVQRKKPVDHTVIIPIIFLNVSHLTFLVHKDVPVNFRVIKHAKTVDVPIQNAHPRANAIWVSSVTSAASGNVNFGNKGPTVEND